MDFKSRIINFDVSDGVTSLMYASTIGVVLSISINLTNSNIFISVGIVMFIFIDMLSRIWVPLSFPEGDITNKKKLLIQLLKALFEISAIFFLLLTIDNILNSTNFDNESFINNHRTFAIYLTLTFLANLVILLMMEDASWAELFMAGIIGKVFDLKGVAIYTAKFNELVTEAFNNIQMPGTPSESISKINSLYTSLFKKSLGRTIAQLVAHHIAWVSIFVACFLYLELDINLNIIGILIEIDFILVSIIFLLFLILFVPTILFFVSEYLQVKKSKTTFLTHLLNFLASLFVILLLLSFYSTFNIDEIVYVMIFEQGLFGIFLLFAIQK